MHSEEILKFLPEEIADGFRNADIDWETAEEIRIRTGKPVLFYKSSEEFFLEKDGTLIPTKNWKKGSLLSAKKKIRKEDTVNAFLCMAKEGQIKEILDKMSGYSMYAYEDELRQGYFTLEGGHRVGITGKAVIEDSRIKTMKYLSFLNIRIAHEKKNCGKKVVGKMMENGRICNTLIVSPPGCGKTTLLRDLIRLISDGFYYENLGKREYFPGETVGVVDERSEIGASVRGVPTAELGIRTDLIDGCPKHTGIFMLLRSMAPKVIAVDEIGSEKDFEAILQAVNSGCTILATAHGNTWQELARKEVFASFMREHVFERYIVLSGKNGKGTVEEVYQR